MERADGEDAELLEPFTDKDYRDAYLDGYVKGSIAIQIRALREKLGLSQVAFAKKIGMTQSVVSRLEDSEYGSVTVNTLLKVAKENNVGLHVRFTDYLTVIHADLSPPALRVDDVVETYNKARASRTTLTSTTPTANNSIIFLMLNSTAPAARATVDDHLGGISWQNRPPLPLGLFTLIDSPAFETLCIERSTQT
jgi:transcriptional regulator with XRE-family HTH domain